MKAHRTVAVAKPVRIDGLTIVSVEETQILRSDNEPFWWYGSKCLRAVVLQSESGIRAYDMEAGETSIAKLKEEFVDLQLSLTDDEMS